MSYHGVNVTFNINKMNTNEHLLKEKGITRQMLTFKQGGYILTEDIENR